MKLGLNIFMKRQLVKKVQLRPKPPLKKVKKRRKWLLLPKNQKKQVVLPLHLHNLRQKKKLDKLKVQVPYSVKKRVYRLVKKRVLKVPLLRRPKQALVQKPYVPLRKPVHPKLVELVQPLRVGHKARLPKPPPFQLKRGMQQLFPNVPHKQKTKQKQLK